MRSSDDGAGDMPELIYLSGDDGGHGSDGGSDGDSDGGSDSDDGDSGASWALMSSAEPAAPGRPRLCFNECGRSAEGQSHHHGAYCCTGCRIGEGHDESCDDANREHLPEPLEDSSSDSSSGGSGGSGGSDPFHNSPPANMVSHTHAPGANTHEDIGGLFSLMAVRMRDLALESPGAPEP